MGLDLVEFITAVEASFGIEIPDADAEQLHTPRDVIGYLTRRLDSTGSGTPSCLTQRAFYKTRRTIAAQFGLDAGAIRPTTSLLDVLPPGDRRGAWRGLKDALGAEIWPPTPSNGPFSAHLFGGPRTVGEAAQHLATYSATAVRGASEPWARGEIELTVIRLVETEFGVDMTEHSLDSEFVGDLGVD